MKKPKKIKTDHEVFREEASEFFRRASRTFYRLDNFLKKESEYLADMKNEAMQLKDLLKKVVHTNENVDSTLCNVLLAIRQNEYLEAWYPDHAHKKTIVVDDGIF